MSLLTTKLQSFVGQRFSAQKSDASGEYFTYSVHVESKLKFNLIGNLEQPWKITGVFCFCFGFIHNVARYLELQLNRAAVDRWCLTTTVRATLQKFCLCKSAFLLWIPIILEHFYSACTYQKQPYPPISQSQFTPVTNFIVHSLVNY